MKAIIRKSFWGLVAIMAIAALYVVFYKPDNLVMGLAPTNAKAPASEASSLPTCSSIVPIGDYCMTDNSTPWSDLKAKETEHHDKGHYVVTVTQADNPQVVISPETVTLNFKD